MLFILLIELILFALLSILTLLGDETGYILMIPSVLLSLLLTFRFLQRQKVDTSTQLIFLATNLLVHLVLAFPAMYNDLLWQPHFPLMDDGALVIK